MLADAKEAQRRLSEGGKKGGSAQVPKGFAKLPKRQRREIARQASNARWDRVRANGAAK